MTPSGHLANYGHNIHQTLLESIDLVRANVAGETRYLALCIRALFARGSRISSLHSPHLSAYFAISCPLMDNHSPGSGRTVPTLQKRRGNS